MADDHENDKEKIKKYVRCSCCKEIGHAVEECTRDPNIKTHAKADEEFERIQKMKEFKKLYCDSIAQTTIMLKKSVMIPITIDAEEQIEEVPHAYNPFMRGVMEFDDYNYDIHNPYVLVEDPKFAEVPKNEAGNVTAASAANMTVTSRQPSVSAPLGTIPENVMDPIFSYKNVNNSITDDYEHPMVTIEPSEMELEKIQQEKKAQ